MVCADLSDLTSVQWQSNTCQDHQFSFLTDVIDASIMHKGFQGEQD